MEITKEISENEVIKAHGKFFVRLIEKVEIGGTYPVRRTRCVTMYTANDRGAFGTSIPGATKSTITFTGAPYVKKGEGRFPVDELAFPVRASSGETGIMTQTSLQFLKL